MDKKINKIKESLVSTEYLFVGIFAFVAIAAAVMMMLYIPSVSGLVKGYAEASVLNATKGNSNTAGAFFDSNMSVLHAVASEFENVDPTDKAKVLDICKTIVMNTGFRHVGFTRTDGITVSSSGKSSNTSARGFIRDGLAGIDTLYAHTNCDFDGHLVDMYSITVRNAEGEIVGVLSADVVPLKLSDLDLAGIAGDDSCFFILDTSGRVLYTSSPENEAGMQYGSNLLSVLPDGGTVKSEISYALNSVGEASLKEITLNGVNYYAAFAPLKGRAWTFVTLIPSAKVLSSFDPLIMFTVAAIGVMALLVIVCSLLISMKMRRISEEIGDAVDETMRQTYVDSITGHETIARFRERFAAAMKDTATGHALMSLDVDRFKAVNDMFGFEGGNEIIKRLSDIINRNLRAGEFFARSTGDLFYILAEFSENEELIDLSERIISDVYYQIPEVRLSMSVGIYKIDEPSIRSRVAADRADMARESTKGSKQSRYAFFDSSMLQKIRREKRIEDIMEDALALGEFLVYLQPKFGLGDNNCVVGAEALVRWQHDGKLIPPGEFIPLFEKNGFVNKIDYYIFEEVCKLQKKYENMGYEPKVISVNMSRTHIHHPGFVDELAAMCDKYEVPTKYMEIEITESAAYEDMDILCDIFREIKSKGFHVSIDDFGTGYSSLNMLKDLPVDVLKIDRSFLTENADEHESASIIIGCVVSLAAALEISTICEGIETREQAVLLTKLGCNMAQGFFFARPMPVPDYEKLTYGI